MGKAEGLYLDCADFRDQIENYKSMLSKLRITCTDSDIIDCEITLKALKNDLKLMQQLSECC